MFLFSMSSVMAEETADDEDPLSVEAPSAILMEASTGEILYEKNADEPGQYYEDHDAAFDL